MSKLLYRNNGRGLFENVSNQLGPDLQISRVSRGAAVADVDNDGDLDILINNNGQEPQLLINEGGNKGHWLGIALIGTRSNRDGVGTRIKLVSGDLTSYDQRQGGRSYQSAHDGRLYYGLGARTKVDLIEIRWSSGSIETLKNIEADQIITVKEGSGQISQRDPRWRPR